MQVTPATIRVARRPAVTVTHGDRTPLSQTIGSAVRYV
jgi:hypothetical protein